MDREPARYQVAVHTGDNRLYHREKTRRRALVYVVRAARGDADYIAVEQWSDTVNECTGGWVVVEVIRDRCGYLASIALTA